MSADRASGGLYQYLRAKGHPLLKVMEAGWLSQHSSEIRPSFWHRGWYFPITANEQIGNPSGSSSSVAACSSKHEAREPTVATWAPAKAAPKGQLFSMSELAPETSLQTGASLFTELCDAVKRTLRKAKGPVLVSQVANEIIAEKGETWFTAVVRWGPSSCFCGVFIGPRTSSERILWQMSLLFGRWMCWKSQTS
eukprot:RCo047129